MPFLIREEFEFFCAWILLPEILAIQDVRGGAGDRDFYNSASDPACALAGKGQAHSLELPSVAKLIPARVASSLFLEVKQLPCSADITQPPHT